VPRVFYFPVASFLSCSIRSKWFGPCFDIICTSSATVTRWSMYPNVTPCPQFCRVSNIGSAGWDDFIVQDVAGRSYSIPTVPLDFQYLSPFNIPPNVNLVKAERFEGKVKWYVKPIGFGGDPKAEDNITWLSLEQHTQWVRWRNDLHRSVETRPKPMW
jgi:hypothetical protein